MRWPWQHRDRDAIERADEQLRQSEADLLSAQGERARSAEVTTWARKMNASNRFDVRIQAALRAGLSEGGRGDRSER